jgi:hypothetical protein
MEKNDVGPAFEEGSGDVFADLGLDDDALTNCPVGGRLWPPVKAKACIAGRDARATALSVPGTRIPIAQGGRPCPPVKAKASTAAGDARPSDLWARVL